MRRTLACRLHGLTLLQRGNISKQSLALAATYTWHVAPSVSFACSQQVRMSSEGSGWMGKIGKIIGLGKDKEAQKQEEIASTSPIAADTTVQEKDMSLETYFSFVEKAKMARKMGLGGMMDKMLGAGGDTKAIDELWDKHPAIQKALTADELKSAAPTFTMQRLSQLSLDCGVPEDNLHQVFGMFMRARQAFQMFEHAKAQGRTPKSVEDVQALATEFAQKQQQQTFNPYQIIKPSPTTPASSSASAAAPSRPPPPTPPTPTAAGQRTMSFSSDRFKASPKKAEEEKDKRLGRNEWVQISNGTETQTLKWKKAQVLVDSGKWKVVG
eukprot:c13093_g1_i1.p1 GENE.c13093_g1_i1~~c13093_g1_i1.p1  ORF type:complete len:335 (+),score=101.09 c13093_g1_i1:30-1007(+)